MSDLDDGPLESASTDEVLAVLGSAPTASPPVAPAEGGAQSEAKPETPAAPPVKPEPSTPQAAPTPEPAPPSPQASPEETQALRTELARLQGQVEGLSRPATPQSQPSAKPSALETLPEHKYAFTVPDELMGALTGEDPVKQKQALGAFAQAIAMTTHQTVARQVQAYVQHEVLAHVQNTIQSSRIAEQVHQDFYGDNADLNDPALYPFIATVAQEIIVAEKPQRWSKPLGQKIEARVRQLLNRPRPGAQPQAAPLPPPALLGGSPARAQAPRRLTEEEDIMMTLRD